MILNAKVKKPITMVIGAILCIGIGATLALMWRSSTREAQARAGIEELHRLDERISLMNDPQALQAEWADDAVRLGPDGSIDRGKAEIYVSDRKAFAGGLTFVSYQPQIREVRVVGPWAFEWGMFTATFRSGPRSPLETLHGDLLRVLRREPNGAWRFARVMVTESGS